MRVPTLYFWCDGDPMQAAQRCLQSIGGIFGSQAEHMLRTDSVQASRLLQQAGHIEFAFSSNPDVQELVYRVWCYAEVHGHFPHYIVIDNVSDIERDGDGELNGWQQLMIELTELARFTNAAVHVLAHAVGQYEDGHETIPLSGIANKLGKKPSEVLTLNAGAAPTSLYFSVVKSRHGTRDQSGIGVRGELFFRGDLMQLRDK